MKALTSASEVGRGLEKDFEGKLFSSSILRGKQELAKPRRKKQPR